MTTQEETFSALAADWVWDNIKPVIARIVNDTVTKVVTGIITDIERDANYHEPAVAEVLRKTANEIRIRNRIEKK